MRQKFLIIVILLLTAFVVEAANTEYVTLVIEHNNGMTTRVNLDERPVTTFTKDAIVITTKNTMFNFLMEDIYQVYYERNVITSIETEAHNDICITQRGNQIAINGLAEGKMVTIFDINGKMLLSDIATGVGPMILSIEDLPCGVYVVKCDYVTFKTLKR